MRRRWLFSRIYPVDIGPRDRAQLLAAGLTPVQAAIAGGAAPCCLRGAWGAPGVLALVAPAEAAATRISRPRGQAARRSAATRRLIPSACATRSAAMRASRRRQRRFEGIATGRDHAKVCKDGAGMGVSSVSAAIIDLSPPHATQKPFRLEGGLSDELAFPALLLNALRARGSGGEPQPARPGGCSMSATRRSASRSARWRMARTALVERAPGAGDRSDQAGADLARRWPAPSARSPKRSSGSPAPMPPAPPVSVTPTSRSAG